MSKVEENLVGRVVTLYLDGGWEVSGSVGSITDNKIVLEQEYTGGLFLIFREKVSCLRLEVDEGRVPRDKEVIERKADKKDKYDHGFPMNDIGYNDSGMSIPIGMLENLPDEDDDLSITFGGSPEGENVDGRGQIEFRIDDDSTKED